MLTITKHQYSSIILDACEILLSELKLPNSLNIDIIIVDSLEGIAADCEKINRQKYIVRLVDREDLLISLSHEFVHIKQHYYKEIVYVGLGVHKNEVYATFKWRGIRWRPKESESLYWDYPHEKEANELEQKLANLIMDRLGICIE